MKSNKDIGVGILTRHTDLTASAERQKSISVALKVYDQGEGMENFLKNMETNIQAHKDYVSRVRRMIEETPPDSARFPAVFFTYRADDGLHLAHSKGLFLSEMSSMTNLTVITALRDFFAKLTGKNVNATLGIVELPITAAGNSDLIRDYRMAAEKEMLEILTTLPSDI